MKSNPSDESTVDKTTPSTELSFVLFLSPKIKLKGIPFSNRLSELLNKNLEYIEDSNLIEYYKKYLQQLMDISKEYQKEVIEMEK